MLLRVPEAHSRSFVKAVTWRVVGSVDTFLISYFVSYFVVGRYHPHQNLALQAALWISFIETFTKILIYYFHERFWAWVPWWQPDNVAAVVGAQPAKPS